MKTIPAIREDLLKIATRSDLTPYTKRKIRSLVKAMHRRPAVRRAAVEHAKVTEKLRKQVLTYAANNAKVSYAKMGERFNLSIGRISEILAGKRAA